LLGCSRRLSGRPCRGRYRFADIIASPARRGPGDLTEEDTGKLEALFGKLSRLRTLYEVRVQFRAIFETAPDRRKALREFVGLWLDILDHFPALDGFIRTFEAWQDEILNYFEAGHPPCIAPTAYRHSGPYRQESAGRCLCRKKGCWWIRRGSIGRVPSIADIFVLDKQRPASARPRQDGRF
jgi:hypothetical protein